MPNSEKKSQPSESEIKEIWEWCGLTTKSDNELTYWYRPDGSLIGYGYNNWCPEPDLNNLFRYAVPVFIKKIMAEQECSSDVAYAILFKKWLQKLELDIPNHEGTLFWAIWEVIKK